MNFKAKAIAAVTALALMSTAAMAQDIAVIAGSVEDAFMDKIKKGVDDATAMVTLNGGTVQYLRTQNYENLGYTPEDKENGQKSILAVQGLSNSIK